MRTRFTWILAVLALVSIGVVMACSTKYSSSSNGLVVVPTQYSDVMQTFSINLSNGQASQINNVNGPPIAGLPSSVILDPAGAYAYVATTVNCAPTNPPPNTSLIAVQGAILAYKIASDGKLAASSAPVYLTGNPAYPSSFPPCGLDDAGNPNAGNQIAAMTMDSAGKFLFVATALTGAKYTINTNTATPTSTTATLNSVGVAVYAIGANASLTQVTGSPFALQFPTGGQIPSPSALAVTATVFPASFAACSGQTAPSTEYLYVTDAVNYMLLNYMVDTSGTLKLMAYSITAPGISTGTVPSGVAVDPCNRFVYVANATSDNVSAYTICSVVNLNSQPPCQQVDYSLNPVPGSPYTVSPGDLPGPMAVDAYGNFLYVVDTGTSLISAFRISSATGSLAVLAPPTVATNQGPNSIAIRSDDSWLFVANLSSANVSQYAITPASGTLTPQPPITTLNYPSGVAVK
jgi:DNA-binding beta-propeller fold protein YncE